MEFVVLILVLVLRSMLGVMPGKRHDQWFLLFRTKMLGLFKRKAPHLYDPDRVQSFEQPLQKTTVFQPSRWFIGTGAFVFSVLLPVAGLSLLMSVLEDVIWGLPAFALSILVLLYSLGRKDSVYWLTRFQIAWRQRDLQGAYQYAAEVLPNESLKDEKQLYQKVFSRLVGLSFQDFFLITFWFMWLGAEGALLARLITLYTEASADPKGSNVVANEKVTWAMHLLEWIPAKLTGLSFMMTGHFVYSSQQWLITLFSGKQSHETVLTRIALGALGEKVEGTAKEVLGEAEDNALKDEQLQGLEALINRSRVLWVISIAVTVVLMAL